jgi:stage V sporulation protein R
MDWFFFQDFFTEDLVDKLNLYLWGIRETITTVDIVRTDHKAKDVKEAIIGSFAHSRVPKIEIVDGDFRNGNLFIHRHTGLDLDIKYATEVMRHIYNVTERDVYLDTVIGEEKKLFVVFKKNKGSMVGDLEIQILDKMPKRDH